MAKITSRTDAYDEALETALSMLRVQWADEHEELIDKLDSFLELVITAEFNELKADIMQVKATNDALMEENMRFRDEITALSVENLRLSFERQLLS